MHTRTSVISALLAATALLGADAIHVDPRDGDDRRPGASPDQAVRSFAAAMKLAAPGDSLVLRPDKGDYTEPLELSISGTTGQPFVVEGNGATINLGTEVTAGPWTQSGSEWILESHTLDHARPFQASPIFVDNQPLWVPDPRFPHPADRGSVRVLDDRRFAVTFPAGKSPGNSRVFLVGPGSTTSGVSAQGNIHDVLLRDLTVRGAPNDGFNFHGRCTGIRLERVRAIQNGDQGISSHDDCEASVAGSEVAFNGSRAGGVADIGNARTQYDRLLVHHNRGGGFHLKGADHSIARVVSFQNEGRQLPGSAPNLTVDACVDIASADTPDGVTDPWLLDRLRDVAAQMNTVPYPGASVANPFVSAPALQ